MEDERFSEADETPGRDPQPTTGSTGVETADGELELALLESIEQELADVELALERLGDGSYGRCETCGQIVGDDELEAAPARRFCRDHLPFAAS